MLFEFCICLITAYFFYKCFWQKLYIWKSNDVPYKLPLPIFGNFFLNFIQKEAFATTILRLYSAAKENKIFGIFTYNGPTLMICDPELIKKITVKDFDHFSDRSDMFFKESIDPIGSKNLFAIKGNKWRSVRASLSPAFTGSKIRGMFELIMECGKQFSYHLEKMCGNNSKYEVELKTLFLRFTNDSIATTAFGVHCNSFEDPENVFNVMGREAAFVSVWRVIITNFVPQVAKLFGITVFSNTSVSYFANLIKENKAIRLKNNIYRPDLLHLLIQAQHGKLLNDDTTNDSRYFDKYRQNLELTDDDIIGNAFFFFFAGYETVSTALCFCVYEVALQPEIQKKLQNEIDQFFVDNDGNINYEILNKMTYLNMVVSETLRKWPSATVVDRKCVQPYKLEVEKNKFVNIQSSEIVTIPIFGIHRDARHYKDPETFDPERFNDSNKDNINPYTYLPFGIGPRNCIGARLAYLEMKIALLFLFRNFNVHATNKTPRPLKLNKQNLNLDAEKGFWVALEKRTL